MYRGEQNFEFCEDGGMPNRPASTGWPDLPDVGEPAPPRQRRAWGKLPHAERYRRQRRDLLRGAARLASRKGYAGTRVADIVAEAGLSKSTFYEHFSSKEDCFVELHRRTSAAMLRSGIQAAEAADGAPPFEALLAVIRAMVGYVEQDPRLAVAFRTELGAAHPQIREQREENVRQITELVTALARRLRTPLDQKELDTAARIVVHGVISILPELEREPATLDEELDVVARVGTRALGFDLS